MDPNNVTNSKEDIDDVVRLAHAQDALPVIRDWSHMDFFGRPFCEPQFRAELIDELAGQYNLIQTAIIRHPLGMWLSFQGSVLGEHYAGKEGFERFLDCYNRYVSHYSAVTFHKYEEFVAQRNEVTARMCQDLDLNFDPAYADRFTDYVKITGDPAGSGKSTYRNSPRVIAAALFNYLITVPKYLARIPHVIR
mgnify:CR=1 FL=1